MSNRLASETSPYLRQHADNPVDWWPWSNESLGRAKSEDKPILLSIGYSACHWCHVMAHESFEDADTARLMNEQFVCIKVDREEMPDVDQIYQQSLQLMGESGGWPLTMFLTPDGIPYYGGTYFPKKEGYGRPSFTRLLSALSQAFRTQRSSVTENARQFSDGLKHLASHGRAPDNREDFSPDSIDSAATRLALRVDRREGGFQGAPKFPNPKAMELILRGARRAIGRGEPDGADLLACVTTTLRKMAEGGIYDQIGGGFSRYSTDGRWLVPHFEKMLYDNGQLLALYAEAYQLAPEPLFARVIDETVEWLEREMRATDGQGGLYTAQDADSEGVEGKYYVWSPESLREVLSAEDAELVARVWDVTPGGNWNDPHGHGPAQASILHVVDRVRSDDEQRRLAAARATLYAARRKRVPPGTDDKVLASSNGLAILGLAEAGRILGQPRYVESARRTAEFVLGKMRDSSGRLYRTFHAQKGARFPGTLDDHALVADGLIALYEATGEARWLDDAYALTRLCVQLFYDEQEAAFFMTAADDPGLIERPLSSYDHAVPSGMSVCLENLVRLGDVCGEPRWLEIAGRVLRAYYARAMENPFGFSNLLNALDLELTRPAEIVLAGDDGSLARAVARVYLPNRVIARAESAPERLRALVDGKTAQGGKPTAYVCRNFACERPLTDPAALEASLKK